MSQPIQIQITQTKGQPLKVEVFHAEGETCTAITAPLNQLGCSQTQLKSEYFEPTLSVQKPTDIHLE
ncbi:hypothetical protein PCC9214_05619 [Planktothrix tepida]|uniref:DUF2997 domain-containing protein n=1 Tax=Planktothrix tepida PCC 9214 TaxID=671072 RepID=A0A1J1LV76_9CYAN|nr:hypothetical protein [Planktothrix tepida]CAD5989637.1 hypothetical protein PCC9214_05619 [Planktothrix tepida]CUR35521.1 hypothetical protein PL9214670147 [Planktothrix tepida PCC 9214]